LLVGWLSGLTGLVAGSLASAKVAVSNKTVAMRRVIVLLKRRR
jgi:hypothetical protein